MKEILFQFRLLSTFVYRFVILIEHNKFTFFSEISIEDHSINIYFRSDIFRLDTDHVSSAKLSLRLDS